MSRSVKEWIGKTDDSAVPPRVRLRVREKDGNCCRGCGRPLRNEASECDHYIPLIEGGKNRETNLWTLCLWCHKEKTKTEVGRKSRSYKRRKSHAGIKSTRASFATNRNGPFKKKISGEVVRRT